MTSLKTAAKETMSRLSSSVLSCIVDRILKCDVIKMKFLKLWDLSGYSGSTPKKFRRVCIEFSKHNWATISETICPEMLIFGK